MQPTSITASYYRISLAFSIENSSIIAKCHFEAKSISHVPSSHEFNENLGRLVLMVRLLT